MPSSSSPLKRFSSRLRSTIRLKKSPRGKKSSPLSQQSPSSSPSRRADARIADLRERRQNAFSSEFKVSESGELMQVDVTRKSSSPNRRRESPGRGFTNASPDKASTSPRGSSSPPFMLPSPGSKPKLPIFKLGKKRAPRITIQDYELSAKNFTTNENTLKLAYEKIFDEEDLAVIADCLVKLSLALGTTSTMMQILFQLEFEKTKNHFQTDQILLRNSLCSKCLDYIIENEGRKYIRSLILPLVTDMLNNEELNLEMDPLHLYDPMTAEANSKHLQHYILTLLNTLKFQDAGILSMSFQMRFTCSIIHEFAQQYEWDSPLNISGFIVNRLIRPALLTPDINGLITGSMSPMERRNFYLMAQVLQKMASGKLFQADNEHEKFLLPLNDFVSEHSEEFRCFLLDLSPHPSIARIEQRKLARLMETHMERKTITLKHSTELEQVVELMDEKYKEEYAESMNCSAEDLMNMWKTGEVPTVQQSFGRFAVAKKIDSSATTPEAAKEKSVEDNEPEVSTDKKSMENNDPVQLPLVSEQEEELEEQDVPVYGSAAAAQPEDEQVEQETSLDDPEAQLLMDALSDEEHGEYTEPTKPDPILIPSDDDEPSSVVEDAMDDVNPESPQAARVEPIIKQNLQPEQPATTPIPEANIASKHQETQAAPQTIYAHKSTQDSLETEKDAEIVELREKCAAMEQKVTSTETMKMDFATLQSKYEQLVQEVKQQESAQDSLSLRRASLFAPSENHFERLKEEKRKLQSEFDQQQQIMREMKASIDKERVILEKQKQIVVLDAKMQNEKEMELERRENDLLLREKNSSLDNDQLHKTIAGLEQQLQESKNEASAHAEENQSLQQKQKLRISELESQMRSLEQTKVKLEQKVQHLEGLQASQPARLDAEERLKELIVQLQQTETDLKVEKQKVDAYAKEVAQNKSLALQVQKLTSENESLQNQLSMQEVELEMLQKRSKAAIESPTPTPSSSIQRVSSEDDNADKLQISTSATSRGEIELLTAKNQLQEQVAKLQEKLKENELHEEEAQKRVEKMRIQEESLVVENETLRNELSGAMHEIEQLRQSKSLLSALNSNDSRLQVQALHEIQKQRSLLNGEQREFVQNQRMKKREIRLLVEELNERALQIQQKESQINQRARLLDDREDNLHHDSEAYQRKIENVTDDAFDALQRKKSDAENALQIITKQLKVAKEEYAALKKNIKDLHRLQSLPHHVWGTVGSTTPKRTSRDAISPRRGRGTTNDIHRTKSSAMEEDTSAYHRKRTPSKRLQSPTRRKRSSPPMPSSTDLLEGLRAFSPPRSTRTSLSSSLSSVDAVPSTQRASKSPARSNVSAQPQRRLSPRRAPSMRSPRSARLSSAGYTSRENNIQILKRILSKVEGQQQGMQALLQELPPQELEDMVKMYFTQGG
eukprot:CAMPEP_0117451424 /NCGR_PEP_ID=MMETSP0759-20121206/8998_1 /TAXON_ID=63605 /ORGANISM="Percolomonas cosmopolitus, Strain WS" /LENGTH=1409 /DNA_ID=CAMNT_0005244019 /DNA_START=117 /DNA_END=4343 /DNA_ORIENTATION=+